MRQSRGKGSRQTPKKCVKATAFPCKNTCLPRKQPSGKDTNCRNPLKGQAATAVLWITDQQKRLDQINKNRSQRGVSLARLDKAGYIVTDKMARTGDVGKAINKQSTKLTSHLKEGGMTKISYDDWKNNITAIHTSNGNYVIQGYGATAHNINTWGSTEGNIKKAYFLSLVDNRTIDPIGDLPKLLEKTDRDRQINEWAKSVAYIVESRKEREKTERAIAASTTPTFTNKEEKWNWLKETKPQNQSEHKIWKSVLDGMSKEERGEYFDWKRNEAIKATRSQAGKKAATTRKKRADAKTARETELNATPEGKALLEAEANFAKTVNGNFILDSVNFDKYSNEKTIALINYNARKAVDSPTAQQKEYNDRQPDKINLESGAGLTEGYRAKGFDKYLNTPLNKRQSVFYDSNTTGIPWTVSFLGGDPRVIVGAKLHDNYSGQRYIELIDTKGKNLRVFFPKGDREMSARARRVIKEIAQGKSRNVDLDEIKALVTEGQEGFDKIQQKKAQSKADLEQHKKDWAEFLASKNLDKDSFSKLDPAIQSARLMQFEKGDWRKAKPPEPDPLAPLEELAKLRVDDDRKEWQLFLKRQNISNKTFSAMGTEDKSLLAERFFRQNGQIKNNLDPNEQYTTIKISFSKNGSPKLLASLSQLKDGQYYRIPLDPKIRQADAKRLGIPESALSYEIQSTKTPNGEENRIFVASKKINLTSTSSQNTTSSSASKKTVLERIDKRNAESVKRKLSEMGLNESAITEDVFDRIQLLRHDEKLTWPKATEKAIQQLQKSSKSDVGTSYYDRFLSDTGISEKEWQSLGEPSFQSLKDLAGWKGVNDILRLGGGIAKSAKDLIASYKQLDQSTIRNVGNLKGFELIDYIKRFK